jgi:hypothetical protein
MANLIVPRTVLMAILVLVSAVISGCGSQVEGTYSDGGVMMLELRPGGKAAFTFMGDTYPCAYKSNADRVMLDCAPNRTVPHSGKDWPRNVVGSEKIDFTIHDDGSLTSTALMVPLKKTK